MTMKNFCICDRCGLEVEHFYVSNASKPKDWNSIDIRLPTEGYQADYCPKCYAEFLKVVNEFRRTCGHKNYLGST